MSSAEPYVIFELGNAAYGIRSTDVLHVEILEHISPVPNTAAAVEGIVFSRGQLFPALNLRTRFGLPPAPHTARTRLLFVRVHDRTVALIVDSAREFRRIETDAIRATDAHLHGAERNHVRGVATVNGRMVLLLDIVAVLNLDDPSPLIAAEAAAQTSA